MFYLTNSRSFQVFQDALGGVGVLISRWRGIPPVQ